MAFLLAMAMYPSVQKKAQGELDRVVGAHRLPQYEDMENLPFVCAIIMETLRWMPVLPIGVPHAVIDEDVYNGYRIPKGCLIIPVSHLDF